MCRLRVALSRFSMSAVETSKKPARVPSPQMPTALLWIVALIESISRYRASAESPLSELRYLQISSCDQHFERVQSSTKKTENPEPMLKRVVLAVAPIGLAALSWHHVSAQVPVATPTVSGETRRIRAIR